MKNLSFAVRQVALAAAIMSLMSCGDPEETSSVSLAATAGSPDVYPLAMGATNLQVGTVSVWNDADNLYVRYDASAGYELNEAHLCVSAAAFPWTPPGQCPYNAGVLPAGTTSYLFTVPWSDLGFEGAPCDALLYLQAHATINAAGTSNQVGSAYAGTFKGRIAYSVTCDLPPQEIGCTYTKGYWKTHASAWPVASLTIGGVTYTKKQLITLLGTPPKGDCSLIMGSQFIAALLNGAGGASAPPEVQQALADAEAWMAANKDADGLLPYGIRPTPEGFPNPAVWDDAINLGAVLDAYNNGLNGPAHCP